MRWTTLLGAALALGLAPAACRQTVYIDYDGSLGGSDTGFEGGPPPNCSGVPIDLKAESPDVIVAMDRSAGMLSARFGDTNPFAAARDALEQYAAQYQGVVHFGYVEFPGTFQCNGGAQACCASSVYPPSQTIDGFEFGLHICDAPMPSCPVYGPRATAAALKNAISAFPQSGRNNRLVLLVTNGQPECGTGQDSPCNEARNAANQLQMINVSTHVVAPIAVPDADTTTCLELIAAYGGGKNNSNFHPASDPTALSETMSGITRTIANYACHLDPVSPFSNGNSVALYWKETAIPFNHDNGWDFDGNGFTIELHGPWCQTLIEDGPTAFSLRTGCEPTRH